MKRAKSIFSKPAGRRQFLKRAGAVIFLTIAFAALTTGIFQLYSLHPLKVFAEETENMYIPKKIKDLDPNKYTNLVMSSYKTVTAVTCDDWDKIVFYIKRFYAA